MKLREQHHTCESFSSETPGEAQNHMVILTWVSVAKTSECLLIDDSWLAAFIQVSLFHWTSFLCKKQIDGAVGASFEYTPIYKYYT